MNQTIDITPTWSAIGEMYISFAQSNEQAAIRPMAPEIRKAFALATAATALYETLNESQRTEFNKIVKAQMGNNS